MGGIIWFYEGLFCFVFQAIKLAHWILHCIVEWCHLETSACLRSASFVWFSFLLRFTSFISAKLEKSAQVCYYNQIFFKHLLDRYVLCSPFYFYPLRFFWLRELSYEDKIEGKTGKSLKTMNFLFQPLQLHESILRSFFLKIWNLSA